MKTLFIANKNYSSWSLRPWVLMRELNIPFEERLVPFEPVPGNFKAFSPTGKVPCLHEGGAVIWDSLAITEYLAESFPGVWPQEGAARAWARCAAAEMHSGFFHLRNACGMNCGLRLRLRGVSDGLKADLARLDALWNEGLSRFGGPFLAGTRFSAVDAFFAPVAFRIQTYSPPGLSQEAQAYVGRLLALPSLQSWYRDALREPWRDPAHEDEALASGELLQDLRQADGG